MNAKILPAVIALCLGLSAPSFANDEHHPEKAAGAKPAAALTAAPSAANGKALEANAARLQAQAKRIARAKPGAERDKLVAEHLHSLHDSMEMAEGMMTGMEMDHCPMMGGKGGMGMDAKGGGMAGMGMGGKGMGGMGATAADATAAERMERMEKRMDMMEQMMKGGASKP